MTSDVEPIYYVPVLPFGSYQSRDQNKATDIQKFNPLDIIKILKIS